MPSPLFWTVYDRLAQTGADPRVADLVEAAFTSPEALEDRLSGAIGAAPPAERTDRTAPVRTWLLGIEVTGFRGIGRTVTLDLPPGPGLTLIVGRNGAGKSSLSEALEVLLTGDNRRWKERHREWRSGWRNVHSPDAVEVKARFAVEGRPPVELVRAWGEGDDLDGGTLAVRRDGHALPSLDDLGWKDALVTHRPLLSYAELGGLLNDGPSKLYDSLKAILGLDELTGALDRLAAARLSRDKALKAVKAEAAALVARLSGLADARAQRVVGALGKKWDLEAVEGALAAPATDAPPALVALRDVQIADADAVREALTAHRAAVDAAATLARSATARQKAIADLVEAALRLHGQHGDRACPVCETGSLDAAWSRTARERLLALRQEAKAAEEAQERLTRSLEHVKSLVRPPPGALAEAAERGHGEAALAAWRAYTSPLSTEPQALMAHLEATLPPLRDAMADLQQRIRDTLDAGEAAWRPVAGEVAAWLGRARAAQAQADGLRAVKAAETWLKEAEDDIRSERFAPIALQSRDIWAALRQESHVELAGVALEGARTTRRVDLAVKVDGADSSALGVMSQGEVNALALSLFVPRLTHPDSPFRFLVIDDPVQAMDPFKVDGLAQVLQTTAQTHQVIVLTHDTRLQDAVRRMQIPARVYEVGRRPGSLVEVRRAMGPVEQVLDDARAVALSRPAGKVAGRVVPALCRQAVEAELTEAVRRRLLARGEPGEHVEELLRGARTTVELAALALFDDADRGADVLPHLDRRYGKSSADLFSLIKRAVHQGYGGDVLGLVDETRDLVGRLHRELA